MIAFVGLGANLGDPDAQIRAFLAGLAADARCTGLNVSTLRWTDPVGRTDQPRFLNGVCTFRWNGDVWSLHAFLQDAERNAGRTAKGDGGPRPLDLDLLLFGDERVDERGLTVPHPRMRERPFVLEPLMELGWRPA